MAQAWYVLLADAKFSRSAWIGTYLSIRSTVVCPDPTLNYRRLLPGLGALSSLAWFRITT